MNKNAPLSKIQKASISILARKAWDAWDGREDFLDCNCDYSPSAAFKIWRQCEQVKAIKVQSLTDATQGDYLRLRAHFEELSGDSAKAYKTHQRAADETRITRFHQLQKALQERELTPAYAESICSVQYKCPVADATADQLLNLIITIRKRRKPVKKATGPTYVEADLGSLTAPTTAEDPF